MGERIFNGGLVVVAGSHALRVSQQRTRELVAGAVALRQADAALASAHIRQSSVRERLARARAARAESDARLARTRA